MCPKVLFCYTLKSTSQGKVKVSNLTFMENFKPPFLHSHCDVNSLTLQEVYPQQTRLINQDFLVVKQAKDLSYA